MKDRSQKLRESLRGVENSSLALTEVLKSELASVFNQFLDVGNIDVTISENGVTVVVSGEKWKKVGYYYG